MNKQKVQNYLGLLFFLPVLLLFFVSEYRHRTFEHSPEETKVHKIIQEIFESLFHRGQWYAGASTEALYGWWVLLGVSAILVWKFRGKLGALAVRAAETFHSKV